MRLAVLLSKPLTKPLSVPLSKPLTKPLSVQLAVSLAASPAVSQAVPLSVPLAVLLADAGIHARGAHHRARFRAQRSNNACALMANRITSARRTFTRSLGTRWFTTSPPYASAPKNSAAMITPSG